MKIVVAGASGLIGRRLAKALLAAGHTVVNLTTRAIAPDERQNPSLRRIPWDGRTISDWRHHLEDSAAVINLSGQSLSSGRWTASRKKVLLSSRLDSTRALVEAMRTQKEKPLVFVNASAVGYYGPVATGDVAEDQPAGSDFLATLCAQWEREALAASYLGVRTVVLRSAVVLDAEGGALRRLVLPFRLFVGGSLGNGAQWLPWIHYEDQIRAILYAIEEARISGPVNLVAPGAVTMDEFCRTLGRVLHRPSLMRVPGFVLKAILGEMATVVLTGQRAVPQKLLQSGFRFTYPTLPEALSHILKPSPSPG
jgi:uncharacterized protein (TIGR01777 family)